MKKLFILLAALITLSASAQVSRGAYVQVVRGLMGTYQPSIALAAVQVEVDGQLYEKPLCYLHLVYSTDYCTFDDDSRILIKFNDDSKFTLPRHEGDQVTRDYSNSVVQGHIYHHYNTYTAYDVPQEFLDKLLTGALITKIRAVTANGNIVEYEIKEGYQQDFTEKIKQSYSTARAKNQERKANMNDADF